MTKGDPEQISNWFIIARRRQLPAMVNEVRIESDSHSARPAPPTLSSKSLLPGPEQNVGFYVDLRSDELGLERATEEHMRRNRVPGSVSELTA